MATNRGNTWEDRKIGFNNLLTGIKAFSAHLENVVHNIHNNIPVYFMNTGDETYYNTKFEKTERTEIYKSNPRIILKIDTTELDFESTGSITNFKYLFENKMYQSDFRSLNIDIPISCNVVTPNFIFGFEYFEMLISIFSDINVFTYKNLGNSLEGKYDNKSYNFEFPPIEPNSTAKNFIINFAINLALPLYVPRYKTIQQLNHQTGKIDGINNVEFGLDPVSSEGNHTVPKIILNNRNTCDDV